MRTMGMGNYGLFSWRTLLVKAGVNAVAVTIIAGIAQWIAHGKATGDWTVPADLQTALMSLLAGAGSALWTAGKNWAKNHQSSPLSKIFGAMLLAGLLFNGCNTVGPSRPLVYDMEFGDRVGAGAQDAQTTDALGDGQNTTFKVHVKAPAGTKLEDIVGMKYVWNADQSGEISVSKQASSDQTAQAELIKSLAELQRGAWQDGLAAGTGLVNTVAPLAAPLIGTKIQSDAALRATEQSNELIKMQKRVDALTAIVDRLTAKPVPTSTPEVVPLPEK